jgi:hypothetical protein
MLATMGHGNWTRVIGSALILASLLLPAAQAAAGMLLVVDSSGMGHRKGDMIDGNKTISVPAGAELALMDETGRALTIKGPYDGVPGGNHVSGGPGLLARIAAIMTAPSSNTATIILGAARSGSLSVTNAEPVLAQADAPQVMCAEKGTTPVLWRSDATGSSTATLRRKGTAEQANLSWATSQKATEWPAPVKRIDGASYTFEVARTGEKRTFTLRVADKTFANDAQALAWFSAAGCKAQAQAWIKAVAARNIVNSGSAASPNNLFK